MVGVVGVATDGEELSNGLAGRHGGNLDDHLHGRGAQIYFPVRQPGGMFAVGDMHAAMGDGEICFTGVEIAGEVDVRFDVARREAGDLAGDRARRRWVPHATGGDVRRGAAARRARRLRALLVDEWGFTMEDAFIFLSVACDAGHRQACQPSPRASARSRASRSRRSTPARRRSASSASGVHFRGTWPIRTMNPVHEATTCAVAATAEIIGAKWTALLVHDLSEGPRRFSRARALVPAASARARSPSASARSRPRGSRAAELSPRRRRASSTELTEKGESLLPIIDAMREFGHSWLACGHDAPARRF